MAMKLQLIFWWILIFYTIKKKNIYCEVIANIHQVESVLLQPMPLEVKNVHMLTMNLQKRRSLCINMVSEMKNFFVSPEIETDFYVPSAHMYKFDDEEDCLSIQCPTVPVFYISPANIAFSDNKAYAYKIRTLKPRIDHYKFSFEIAENVTKEYANDVSTGLKQATRRLYTLGLEDRWYLCQNARKIIRFKLETSGMVGQPYYHTFRYSTSWEETYLAFPCSTDPSIYLRTDHSDSSRPEVITIVLEGDARTLDQSQFEPHENVALLHSSS